MLTFFCRRCLIDADVMRSPVPPVAPTIPTTRLSACRTRRGGATRGPSRCAPLYMFSAMYPEGPGRGRDDYDFRTSARKENLELELRFAALIYLDVAPGVGRFYRKNCLCDLQMIFFVPPALRQEKKQKSFLNRRSQRSQRVTVFKSPRRHVGLRCLNRDQQRTKRSLIPTRPLVLKS